MYFFSDWLSSVFSALAKLLSMIHFYEAQGFWARFYGWHGFRPTEHVLYLPRCYCVHGFALKQPLWVRFINQQGQPIGAWRLLAPYRYLCQPMAYGVLECVSLDMKKRLQIEEALQGGWLLRSKPWRLTCFGRIRYDK